MGRKDDEIDVGKRIAGWRKRKGISQIEVARRADLAPSYLSRIEGGKIHPTFRMASRIASALGMSLDDLLGHSPPRRKGRPCPVSVSGTCLIDLLETAPDPSGPGGQERYTPQQLRLLRRFSALLQESGPKMLDALEVLIAQAGRKGASG